MRDFTGEEIEGVVKAFRKFVRANLAGIDLSRADLRGVRLFKVNLTGANLTGADLSGANLSNANLREANLYRNVMSKAYYDKDTKFPEGFNPETTGMVLDNSS